MEKWCVKTHLRAKSFLATTDDACKGVLSTVDGHMLLKPRPGAGRHVVYLAVGPQTLVKCLFIFLNLSLAIFDLANHMDSLKVTQKY